MPSPRYEPTPPDEIIVVNTGAGSLRELLAGSLDTIVLIERSTAGLPGVTRNLGLAEARAPIIAFLAADCLATGDWLAKRIAAHAGTLAVASAILPAPGADGRVPMSDWACCLLLHARRLPFNPPRLARQHGVSYARELFERHGTFLEHVRIAEDTEFNLRLTETPVWASALDRHAASLSRHLPGVARRPLRARPAPPRLG